MVGQSHGVKRKIGITISEDNAKKIEDIIQLSKGKESFSSVVDSALDSSLSEISALIQMRFNERLNLEETLLENRLKELRKVKKDMEANKS